MAGVAASGSGVSNFLSPSFRLQSADIQAPSCGASPPPPPLFGLSRPFNELIINQAQASHITALMVLGYLKDRVSK